MAVLQERQYQTKIVDEARLALRRTNAVLVYLPTGGGKTVIASRMTVNALARNLTTWFICHRDFLVDQTAKTFERLGIDFAFVAAGRRWNPYARMQICSIDTLKNRLDRLTLPNLIIWDECHHVAASGWAKVREWAGSAKHVGLSATPVRLDGKGLDGSFGEIVTGPSVGWLIDEGYLCDYRAFAPPFDPDILKGIRKSGGDYAKGQLEGAMDTSTLIGDMVKTWREHAFGMRTVAFCASVKHSEHVAATFRENGIPAVHLDGSSSTYERRAAARALALGELKVITNVDLFGEGYDLAAQADMDVSIDCVILGRPTQSLGLHLQQIGRGLRTADGKEYGVILDHAGNIARHGLPDEEREWTLQGVTKKPGGPASLGMRNCERCLCAYPPTKPICPNCGLVWVTKSKDMKHVDGELVEVDREEARKSKRMEEFSCQSIEQLIDLGRRRGYAEPVKWAARIWSDRERRAMARIEHQAAAYMRG